MEKYNKLIAVTNRHLCKRDYLEQIKRVVSLNPKSLILREKDLSKEEYENLAKKVIDICKDHNTPCFIHSHTDIAKKLYCKRIHFSIPKLKENRDNLDFFNEISVSCHSLKDVEQAISLGATRIVLGNIFETPCKQGVSGKGLDFLSKICKSSSVPVFAIGGITLDNLYDVIEAGAQGGCMMSGFMKI